MEKVEILEEIIKRFNLAKKQRINYKKFIDMYQICKNHFTELEFANLLGITEVAFTNFKSDSKKNPDREIIILGNRNLTDQQKLEKMLELVQLYDLHKGQRIDYQFFLTMYEKVKTWLTEVELANLLGISATNLRNIRKEGKARLFKNMGLKEETIEKIRKNIIMQHEGKKIYHMQNEKGKGNIDFLELYRPYRIYFTKDEFAMLLGISVKNLWYTMHNMANPKIVDIEKVRKVEELKKEIVEGKYYTKKEIEDLCKTFEISVNDFITYYINSRKFFNSNEYAEALEANQKLWIGRTKIEENELEKYNAIFDRIVRSVINVINQYYRNYYLEDDLKSDMLIFIVYNCGDLIRNFQYDLKVMERMIWTRTRCYAQIRHMQKYKEDISKVKLEENRTAGELYLHYNYDDIELDSDDTQEEKLINVFKYFLEQGDDRQTIIENVSRIFNIEKTEILKMIEKYLLDQGRVVQNKNGEYEIAE